MKRILISFLAPYALLMSAPVSAQTPWLPADAREAAATQLAAQLANTYLAESGDQELLLTRAREEIGSIVETLNDWGANEVAARAPELPEVGLPRSGNLYLDAIARYGACSFHLDALFANTAIDETVPEMRVSVAVAAIAVPLATGMLRYQFMEEGGSDEDLREFLTSDEMNLVSASIQGNRDLVSYTWKECAPTMAALTDERAQAPPESAL